MYYDYQALNKNMTVLIFISSKMSCDYFLELNEKSNHM